MARSFGRDGRGQPGQLPGDQVLEGPRRDRVVGGEVGLEPVQRAGRERQPDLEPQPGRDHPLGAQRAEHLVAGDRVVDARPGVPVQLGDAGPDAEHRGLVRVPRDARSATRSPAPRPRPGSAGPGAPARSRPRPTAGRSRRPAARTPGRRRTRRPRAAPTRPSPPAGSRPAAAHCSPAAPSPPPSVWVVPLDPRRVVAAHRKRSESTTGRCARQAARRTGPSRSSLGYPVTLSRRR